MDLIFEVTYAWGMSQVSLGSTINVKDKWEFESKLAF